MKYYNFKINHILNKLKLKSRKKCMPKLVQT